MPPRLSDAERRLVSAYQEAALRIERLLQSIGSKPQRRRILAQINSILGELDTLTASYLREGLAVQFREGSQEAIAALQRLRNFDVDESFTTLHKEALQSLADDAAINFGKAIEGVRTSASRTLNRAVRRSILGELIVSEIEGATNPAERVQKILGDEGLVAVRTGNRRLTLEHYSSMLTHTVLAHAHNTGAATRYLSNGVQFVEVIERETAPDLTCKTMRGKIVKLGDSRLLPPFHPNCFGGIKPVLGTPSSRPIESINDQRLPAKVRNELSRNI